MDGLTDADKLLRFAKWAGILDEEAIAHLRQRAAAHPEEAQAALDRAKVGREAIYRIIFAVANNHSPDPADVALLNDIVAEAQAQVHLTPTGAGTGFQWLWKSEAPQFDMVLWTAARSTAGLLTSGELKKVKSCPGEGCAFLFMDLSRNGKRRWCEMDLCGNRNKVKRFRQSHPG
jgi:predicted RNA-binding Zn ribbon-like protein